MAPGFALYRRLVNTNFVPSTYHTSQQLQQYAVTTAIDLPYDLQQNYDTKVEKNMNTFKDNFFSSSQSETISAAQFKDGPSKTIDLFKSHNVFYLEIFQPAPSQTS